MKLKGRREWGSVLVICLSVMVLITACGGTPVGAPAETAENGDSGAAAGEALQEVSVALDWYPNAVHSFLYVAQEKGYFEEEGLDVTLYTPSNPSDGIRLVGAGQDDFAISYQTQLLQARAQGVPVVSTGVVVQHPLNTVMVREDSRIDSPSDLEGKSVGYPSIPTNEAILKTMVAFDGGDFSKVDMVDTGWSLMEPLASGAVDATIGGYLNHEYLILEKNGTPVRLLPPVDYGVPDFYELIVISNEMLAESSPDVVKAFWRAARKGFDHTREHPGEALERVLADNEELDPEIERRSLNLLLDLMEPEGMRFGEQRAEKWTDVTGWMSENGLLERDVEPEDAFITGTE